MGSTCRICGARQDCPRLGDRIDAALAVAGRAQGSTIIKIAPAVPVAVPPSTLERLTQRFTMGEPASLALRVTSPLCDRSKLHERGGQKPSKPDTLAPTGRTDEVHAIVPVAAAHQGEPMGADAEARVQRPGAMRVNRFRLRRDAGLEVAVAGAGGYRFAHQVRHRLIEQRLIAAHCDVVCQVQYASHTRSSLMCAGALAGFRHPPMLHIALHELPPGGPQQMRSCNRRGQHREGHAVMELVAKPIGAAGLVERRAGPDPAGQGLVGAANDFTIRSSARSGVVT